MAIQLWSKSEGKSYGTGSEMKKRESEIQATIKKWDAKLKTMSAAEIEEFLKDHKAELANLEKDKERIEKLRVKWHATMDAEMKDIERDARKQADKEAEKVFCELVGPSKKLYLEGTKEAMDCVLAGSNVAFYVNEFTTDIEAALKEAKKKEK